MYTNTLLSIKSVISVALSWRTLSSHKFVRHFFQNSSLLLGIQFSRRVTNISLRLSPNLMETASSMALSISESSSNKPIAWQAILKERCSVPLIVRKSSKLTHFFPPCSPRINCGDDSIWPFIDVFVQIFNRLNWMNYFNVNVSIIFEQEKGIIRNSPWIVNFEAFIVDKRPSSTIWISSAIWVLGIMCPDWFRFRIFFTAISINTPSFFIDHESYEISSKSLGFVSGSGNSELTAALRSSWLASIVHNQQNACVKLKPI